MRHKISVKLGHSWFFLAVQAKTFIWTSCLSLNQLMYFIISYQYYHKISFSCSKNQILSMVDASHSAHYIVSATGVHASTMSRLYSRKHSELKKSTSGCQTKIPPPNTHSTHPSCLNLQGRKCSPDNQNPWQHYQQTSLLQYSLPLTQNTWYNSCS